MATHPASVPTPLNSQFDSNIIRGLLSALALLAGTVGTIFFGLDEDAFNQKAEKLIGALTAFLVVAAPIGYAWWSRLKQPTPPITQQAIDATVKREATLKKAGEASPGVMPDESK